MIDRHSLDALVEEVLAESKLPAHKRGELRKELESHMWEMASELQEQGMVEEEIVMVIKRQFGAPKEIGRSFLLIHGNLFMRFLKPGLITLGALLLLSFSILYALFIYNVDRMPGSVEDPYRIVPSGWYSYRAEVGWVVLTKEPFPPKQPGKEVEQISVESFSVSKLGQPLDAWLASRIVEDDPAVTVKERRLVNGHQTITLERIRGPFEKSLSVYLLSQERAYVFSMSSLAYGSYEAESKQFVPNAANITTLDQLVTGYAAKL